MSQITIQIPDHLEMSDFDLIMLVASRLFEQGKLTSGQAAEIVGLSKRAFLELLGKYEVSVLQYDFEELQKDLKDA